MMVLHYEINHSKPEQSLAEVQKTIAIYDFALVSKLQAGDGKKAWCFVVYPRDSLSALQSGIIRMITIIVVINIIGTMAVISKILPEHRCTRCFLIIRDH